VPQHVGVEVAPQDHAPLLGPDLDGGQVLPARQGLFAEQEPHGQCVQVARQAEHGQAELPVVDVQLDAGLADDAVDGRLGPAGLEAADRILLHRLCGERLAHG